MADEVKAENLGEYHKKFFEKKGAELGMDSSAFLKLTDPKKIEEIIEKYNDWVKEIENLSPDDQKNDGIEKDADYFNRKEEKISNMPQGTEEEKENHNKERANLSKEKEDAGWKKIQVGIALPNTPAMLKVYQYDPNDSTLKDMTEEELRDHFTEKFKKEMGLENSENDNKNAEPLNVSEGQEEDDNHQNDGDSHVDDDTEKYWKNWCDEKGYDYVRDPDTEKQGLAFSVKDNGRVKGNVHYKDNNNVVIGGEEGVADYEIFDALAKRAKDKNQVVNFQGEMTPEFKSRLMAACVLNGVNMMNQPKEKIEISAEWGLDEEAVKKIEEYNRKLEEQPERNEERAPEQPQDGKSYNDYLKDFEADMAAGKKIDISAITNESERMVAYAAAMVAAKNAEKDGIEIKGAPDKTISYKNKNILEIDENGKFKTQQKLDENGNVVLGENGKPEMIMVTKTNPLFEAAQNLPDEAKSALEGHNQGVRAKQLEAARNRLNSNPEMQSARAKEAARRQEFRDNDHKYDENSAFNTQEDKNNRIEMMRKYWQNQR